MCLDTSLRSQTDSTGRHRRNYNTIRVVKTGLCCSLSKIKVTKGCFCSDAIHLSVNTGEGCIVTYIF